MFTSIASPVESVDEILCEPFELDVTLLFTWDAPFIAFPEMFDNQLPFEE